MNVEIGTEAAQFPEKEYINGIIVAMYWLETIFSGSALYFAFYRYVTVHTYENL
jgi:hypothetical protein